MSDPFIAEIRIFAGNFAPRGWAFCDGALIQIAPNTAMFSLVGTTYGGDGRNSVGLPDLRGRAPLHPGRGPGLSPQTQGSKGGAEEVTLTEAQLPSHSHNIVGSGIADSPSPADAQPGTNAEVPQYASPDDLVDLAPGALGATATGAAHNNRQPYLGLNFIVAMLGTYPSRS